jgi:hypothetical protein
MNARMRKFVTDDQDRTDLDESRLTQLQQLQRRHVDEVNARTEMLEDDAAKLDPSNSLAQLQLVADHANDQLQLERAHQGNLIHNGFSGTATAIQAGSWIHYLYNRLTDRRDDLRKLQAPPFDPMARIRRRTRR